MWRHNSWKTLLVWSILIFALGFGTLSCAKPPSQNPGSTPTPSLTITLESPVSPSNTAVKTGTPTPRPLPSATPIPSPISSYGDLHIHTICSDGKGNYEEMIEQALKSELSFMAITDHRMNSAVCREILQKCRAEKRLLCLPGMEVSGRVHLLAIGIQHSIDANMPLTKQVAEIHRQGGLAIAAHPFAPKWLYTDKDFRSGLDAIECPWEITTPPVHLPCVYDSDTHDIYVANMLKCSGKITSFEALKNAVRSRQCTRWDLALPINRTTPSPQASLISQ